MDINIVFDVLDIFSMIINSVILGVVLAFVLVILDKLLDI
jgi:hypothetical protein